MRMVEHQGEEFARLGLKFDGLFERPLKAIDCQGLFCETDKYSRAAFPQLKSNRVRIKQEFSPSSSPLELFFPPKWEINDKVAAAKANHLAIREPQPRLGEKDGLGAQMELEDSMPPVFAEASESGPGGTEMPLFGPIRHATG